MRLAAALALGLLLAAPAWAHWEAPEAMVADLNGARIRRAWGVERADRDAKAPRLLVIRVGDRWYGRPAGARREQAEAWRDRWRHAVPGGLIAVLDARSAAPVVRFGPGGAVAGLTERPPAPPP